MTIPGRFGEPVRNLFLFDRVEMLFWMKIRRRKGEFRKKTGNNSCIGPIQLWYTYLRNYWYTGVIGMLHKVSDFTFSCPWFKSDEIWGKGK